MNRRNFVSDFYDFIDSVEKEMRDFSKSFVRRENVKQDLPDEIDLYNFFERWHGCAKMYESLSGRVCNCYSIIYYLRYIDDYASVKYFVGSSRYHAIKFKDRGTFLVNEKRYHDLKAKKGE